jgi:pimeloyl-ACP methyl ester carboxylesterase
MDEVEVAGLRIAFERAGSGPPLVLLHGILTDSRAWLLQLEAFSQDHTVVAWDAPGCGQSSDPPESFRLPDYADCLAAFIAALDLERPRVMGLSFGAVLALELYRRHPAVPRALLLASAYAGWAGSLPDDLIAQRVEQAERESELPAEEWVPEWVSGLLTSSAPAELTRLVAAGLSQFHPVGYRVIAHSLAEADLRGVLPRIAVPTLLLHGENDERSPLRVAQQLHAQIPQSHLVVIPDVGHIPNVQAPDAFNAAVCDFLRSAVS